MVAEAQSRRLEEQRATFHIPQNPPSIAPAPLRPLEDREQLYSTILSHQVRHLPRRQDPGFLVSWPLFSFGPYPSSPPSTPWPGPGPSIPITGILHTPLTSLGSLQGLPLLKSHQHSLPSTPLVPADGSPAVRASPTPRGTGAPGVAAESSGWRSNGGAKVPAPHTYLLRREPLHQPLHTPGAQSWAACPQPLLGRDTRDWKTQEKSQYPSSSSTFPRNRGGESPGGRLVI